MQYTDKQKAIKNGFIKKDGRIYKQSLLEVWHSKGWLELENSDYCADERLHYGMRLAFDYFIINRANLHSGLVQNTKVDSKQTPLSGAILTSLDNYQKAIRNVPSEFWPIVRQICIEEKNPIAPKKMSERQRTYFHFLCRVDLCRGLDRVISSYTQKLKKK